MTRPGSAGIVQHMNSHTPNSRVGALAAATTAIAFLVGAVVHATHGTFDDQLTTTADYMNDSAFAVALLGTVVGLMALRAGRSNPKWALEGAVAGACLVAIGVVTGLVLGHSPSWFAAVGVPGVLLLLVNTIRIAAAMWREAEWPRWVAVGIGLTVPCGIILAEVGAMAVLAIVWAYVAGRLLTLDTAEAAALVP